MSTREGETAVTLDEARSRIVELCFAPDESGPSPGYVGLEPEFFVLLPDEGGRPRARMPLEGEEGVLAVLDARAAGERAPWTRRANDPPSYALAQGGAITFEPGAQVEHSSAVHPSAALALEDAEHTAQELAQCLATRDATLAACGMDLWCAPASVPQQLRAPRYLAMDVYLRRRGPEGALMMRHSASLQVNLDLGPEGVAQERYLLANLASPLACASFAASPLEGMASRRALVWQRLDPTRTGFPRALLEDEQATPGAAYADFALEADVLLFRTASGADAGEPGFSLRRWILEGHARHGSPSRADVEYHLSTLFPEVRLRRFLELRCADALPARWRAAPVVFWVGLCYETRARRAALALLGPARRALPARWERAARSGLADPELGSDARELWRIALEGARRLPAGYLRACDLDCAEAFRERFVEAGRSPSAELRAAHGRDPAESLAWAREEARCEELR